MKNEIQKILLALGLFITIGSGSYYFNHDPIISWSLFWLIIGANMFFITADWRWKK